MRMAVVNKKQLALLWGLVAAVAVWAGILWMRASGRAEAYTSRGPTPTSFQIPHTDQLLTLYRELQAFKDDSAFHRDGFGDCCTRYYDWSVQVGDLWAEAGLATLVDVNLTPSDLMLIGFEYQRSRGEPTRFTGPFEEMFAWALMQQIYYTDQNVAR